MVALRVLCVPKERISLRLIMKHVCSVLTAAVVGAQLLALAMLVLAEATVGACRVASVSTLAMVPRLAVTALLAKRAWRERRHALCVLQARHH
jgi:hypothetical protein